MASSPPSYFVTVVEDTSSNRVIATATLFTEFQFNHSNHMVSLYACLNGVKQAVFTAQSCYVRLYNPVHNYCLKSNMIFCIWHFFKSLMDILVRIDPQYTPGLSKKLSKQGVLQMRPCKLRYHVIAGMAR